MTAKYCYREQALEAQEMFKTANKVTRPEKALILGFMAGSRDNPCPHLGRAPMFCCLCYFCLLSYLFPLLGNVVTIKLSENQENVLQNDQVQSQQKNRCKRTVQICPFLVITMCSLQTYLTMIVETHFQMNYSTGEWRRIKKLRRLEEGQ